MNLGNCFYIGNVRVSLGQEVTIIKEFGEFAQFRQKLQTDNLIYADANPMNFALSISPLFIDLYIPINKYGIGFNIKENFFMSGFYDVCGKFTFYFDTINIIYHIAANFTAIYVITGDNINYPISIGINIKIQ